MIPISQMYNYLDTLRATAECRDVQISFDFNLKAIFLTLRYDDGTRRFGFSGEGLEIDEDSLSVAAWNAAREMETYAREGL